MASSGNPMFDDRTAARISKMAAELVAFLMRNDGAKTAEVCAALSWVAVAALSDGSEDAASFDQTIERLHNTIDLFALAKRKNMEGSDPAAG